LSFNKMSLYIYAVMDSERKLVAPLLGLDGSPVGIIACGGMSAAFSNLERAGSRLGPDDALVHEAVVEQLMTIATVLPFRFGTLFASQKEVLIMMVEHVTEFRENLARLCHKAEFSLKVLWPAEAIQREILGSLSRDKFGGFCPSNSAAGKYMTERFDAFRINQLIEAEADRRIAEIDRRLSRWVVEKKLERLLTPSLLLKAVYLVEAGRQAEFKQAYADMQREAGNLRYLFSGPWPPYNFVRMEKKSGLQSADCGVRSVRSMV